MVKSDSNPIPFWPDGEPNKIDVIAAILQQVRSCDFVPNMVILHIWDAFKSKLIKRLPRKLKKKLKNYMESNQKIVVSCVIFDRFNNLIELVRCWNLCEIGESKLVIIHNYKTEEDKDSYQSFCSEAGIKYIPCENIGYDIGRLQDVCMNRLPGFPDYDYLIWIADDSVIMRKDFIKQYIDKFEDPKVGCVAMEISKEVKLHIRTTAFCIPKKVAERLEFPNDPIENKGECYLFEHRHPQKTFLQQIEKMRLKAVQVSDLDNSPFWDSGHRKTKSRLKEHQVLFPNPEQSPKKVAFICPVYNTYPEIISSLINQTHDNWHLFLIHDGPSKLNICDIVKATNDPRIEYIETETRLGNWGHQLRRDWIQKLEGTDFDYVVVTNADNFHSPNYCEQMIKGFTNGEVAVYHSQMIHSYINWGVINCKLQQGYLDSAGVMVRKDVAVNVGWKDITAHSADWLYFEAIIKKHGAHKFGKVQGCLLSHN